MPLHRDFSHFKKRWTLIAALLVLREQDSIFIQCFHRWLRLARKRVTEALTLDRGVYLPFFLQKQARYLLLKVTAALICSVFYNAEAKIMSLWELFKSFLKDSNKRAASVAQVPAEKRQKPIGKDQLDKENNVK